jgi:predicted MPP superfamily phosphohydrolase
MSLEQVLANVIVLTGHTHGMQIKSNLLLQRLAGRYALRYRADYESRFVKGLYQLHNEDAKVYVGPGVGFSSDTIVRTVEPKVSFFIFSSPRK